MRQKISLKLFLSAMDGSPAWGIAAYLGPTVTIDHSIGEPSVAQLWSGGARPEAAKSFLIAKDTCAGLKG
jgi:hypothetical protein